MNKIAFWSGSIGVLLFVITSIVAGLVIEDYSYASQFVSESYATGTPYSEVWQGLFMGSGALFFLFGILTALIFTETKGVRIGFVFFAIFYGLGTVIVGFFPCDMGCVLDDENSSISQFVHNVTGAFSYAILPFCFFSIGFSLLKNTALKNFSKYTLLCGAFVLVFVAILFCDSEGPFKGLVQRIIEMTILSWVLYSAALVRRL